MLNNIHRRSPSSAEVHLNRFREKQPHKFNTIFKKLKPLSSPLPPTSSAIGRVIQAFVGVGEEFFAAVHKVLKGAARSAHVA